MCRFFLFCLVLVLSSFKLLTLSPPIPLRLYTLPYWSNPPFLMFDIRALWRSRLSARASTRMSKINKFTQSNLGRRSRRVAHVRRKVPIGYNGAPQIRPKNIPCRGPILKTPLPASFLDLSDLWCQTASGSDPPFFHNALESLTHRSTDAPTDAQTDRSSTGNFDHCRPLRL